MQFRRVLGLLPLALLLLAWHLAVEFKVYPPVLLPPPAKVAMVFVEDWDTVLGNAAASLARVITGISLAFLFAVPLGLVAVVALSLMHERPLGTKSGIEIAAAEQAAAARA